MLAHEEDSSEGIISLYIKLENSDKNSDRQIKQFLWFPVQGWEFCFQMNKTSVSVTDYIYHIPPYYIPSAVSIAQSTKI